MVHVRFEGCSLEMTESELRLNGDSSDSHILEQLSRRLEISRKRLDGHVVDRRPGGHLVIRPEAVYG